MAILNSVRLGLALGLTLLFATGGGLAQDASSSASAPASTEATTKVTPGSLTPDQIAADRAIWKKGDCSNCHGWSGNGHDTGPVPPGPSLRAIEFDFDSVREVVQCGRPGTNMPSHDRLAYTDKRCYGMTSADVGKQKPQKGTPLKPEELDAVAAYVVGYLEGKGDVTKAECEEYYGAGNAVCNNYQ